MSRFHDIAQSQEISKMEKRCKILGVQRWGFRDRAAEMGQRIVEQRVFYADTCINTLVLLNPELTREFRRETFSEILV